MLWYAAKALPHFVTIVCVNKLGTQVACTQLLHTHMARMCKVVMGIVVSVGLNNVRVELRFHVPYSFWILLRVQSSLIHLMDSDWFM